MKKLNNKGFAITGILYTLLVIFLLVLVFSLQILRSNKNMREKSTENLEKIYDGTTEKQDDLIQKISENGKAPVTGKYIFDLSISYLQTAQFEYTGGEQTFTAITKGTYTLEVWGAQGGSATYGTKTYYGGKGGYSRGTIQLNEGDKLYIHVGGQGGDGIFKDNKIQHGDAKGYNGGGFGCVTKGNNAQGGGGGATHIAKVPKLLMELENQKDKVLIVAGGGGGASTHREADNYSGTGGAGGGEEGQKGQPANGTCYSYGTGGSQNNEGGHKNCANNGYTYGSYAPAVHTTEIGNKAGFGVGDNYTSFQMGESISKNYVADAGGGGGYYGGGAGWQAPGGGGSGYIGGVTNGSTEQGIREGNGLAKISLNAEQKINISRCTAYIKKGTTIITEDKKINKEKIKFTPDDCNKYELTLITDDNDHPENANSIKLSTIYSFEGD